MKLLLLFFIAAVSADECPQGGEIYTQGVSEEGKQILIDEHNKYRQMVLDGKVDGQPQAKEMQMLQYDEELGIGARAVSAQCEMKHNIVEDSRFGVGQNLFISWYSAKVTEEDWPSALKSWFSENQGYQYPTLQSNALHYTQVVWANTSLVGCDFIAFYDTDPKKDKYPYCRLYSCNYGPAGNVQGEKPYEEA